MSARIEEWLARMRETREPGPVARVMVARNNRDLGWLFDVTDKTDLGELADRIEAACRDAGFTAYELRAMDADGRLISPLAHKLEPTQLVTAGPGVPALPVSLDESVTQVLKSHRSFAGLGLQALMEAKREASDIIRLLKEENSALRHENAELRRRLTEQWDLADKLHTHELDVKAQLAKDERQGRITETLVNAVMARILRGSATPEGRAIEGSMALSLLKSIRVDQAEKIFPHLTDDQRIALMELVRSQETQPSATPKAAHDASLAAAASNANGKAT